MIYFLELNVLSGCTPKIDFITIDMALEDAQLKDGGKIQELPKSVIGLQFQQAMRNKNDFKGALTRAQLIEMIIRCTY
jgi:hypothetical protein